MHPVPVRQAVHPLRNSIAEPVVSYRLIRQPPGLLEWFGQQNTTFQLDYAHVVTIFMPEPGKVIMHERLSPYGIVGMIERTPGLFCTTIPGSSVTVSRSRPTFKFLAEVMPAEDPERYLRRYELRLALLDEDFRKPR